MKHLHQSHEVNELLEKHGWTADGMFLTDRIAKKNRSWKGVLGAMLYCLVAKWNQLFPFIEKLEPEDRSASWSLDVLESMLRACKNQGVVKFSMCFFVDALDEYDSKETYRDRMIEFIEELTAETDGYGRIKICAASRPENAFEIRLRSHQGFKVRE